MSNFEDEVKKIHPEAHVFRDGVFYFVSKNLSTTDPNLIGAGYDQNAAWCSAVCKLTEQGKIQKP